MSKRVELLLTLVVLGFLLAITAASAIGLGWIGTRVSEFFHGSMSPFQGSNIFGISGAIVMLVIKNEADAYAQRHLIRWDSAGKNKLHFMD